MAAAVAARRLSSSLAASARSTPTGASAPTIRFTTRPFFKRPYSSKHQPDPTKMKEVAENLVKVLKETPSEATRSMAESLVNQLKGFYPPPVENIQRFSMGKECADPKKLPLMTDKADSVLNMLGRWSKDSLRNIRETDPAKALCASTAIVSVISLYFTTTIIWSLKQSADAKNYGKF